MSPWEVIQEALAHKKPARNLQWLADQIGATIQVVFNWKTRGVPPKRFRDIASALGITVDQLEGLTPLPWAQGETTELLPEVSEVAWDINSLPERQRRWVLSTVRDAIELARETIQVSGKVLTHSADEVDTHQAKPTKRGAR